jgi:hypothetical protein
MDINAEQQRIITRYLLGEMSEQERSEFEDRYLDDSVLFEELIAVEDEMMRRYAQGSLSEAERAAFETRYLRSQGNRQRAQFTRSLMNYALSVREHANSQSAAGLSDVAIAPQAATDSQKSKVWRRISGFLANSRSGLRFAMSATLLALIAGGSWLAIVDIRLHRTFQQMQAQQASSLHREQQLHDQLAELNLRLKQQEEQVAQLPSLGSSILPFVLISHLIRQSNPQKPLVIGAGYSAVFLESTLQNDAYKSYSASLETPEGHEIWRQSGLKSWQIHDGSHVLGVILPTTIFKSGNYILVLSGQMESGKLEEVNSYAFRVVRK